MFPYAIGHNNLNQGIIEPSFFENYQQLPTYSLQAYTWNYSADNNFRSLPYYPSQFPFSEFYYRINPPEPAPNPFNITESPHRQLQNIHQIPIKEQHEHQETPRVDQRDIEPVVEQKWKQKYGRNIMSNIFHMALKKIGSHEFSNHITAALSKNRMTITQREFLDKLQEKAQSINSYISTKNMKKILIGNPIGATRADIEFRKLLRIMIRLYLHSYHLSHIFHSGKIRRSSRKLHLQNMRSIEKKLKKL